MSQQQNNQRTTKPLKIISKTTNIIKTKPTPNSTNLTPDKTTNIYGIHDFQHERITVLEYELRKLIELFYRFLFSVFLSAHLFDFLFNPIWMHGYIW